jgi:hypothetical protein
MNFGNKTISAISIGLFLVTSASSAYAFPRSGPLSISGDRGGYVIEYALRMLKLKQSRRQVEFRGSCDSACTLYLALPRSQVCVEPQSSFTFHMPYGATGSGNRLAMDYMLNAYPSWVRSWINSKGGLSSRPILMGYAQASKFLATCHHTITTPQTHVAMSGN